VTSPGSGAQRLLMREVNAKFARLNTPIQATVELTYRCNLRCGHCFVDREETDELTLEEWQDIFPQLREAGIIFLCFTGGEVLLRPDFLDLAFQARRDGFIVGLLTNCTLITPDIARAIAEMKPFLVATSLYGAKAATHESVTMVPGSFEHTLRGIQLLVDAGLVPTVHIAIMKNNLVELPQIVELVEGQGAKAAVSFGMVPSKTGSEYPCHYEPGFEGLFGCGVSPENLGSTELLGQLLCRAGKSICAISPQGDIYPCIMFP
jgi:MoaA/NifB/PqqE/SkfB family radical SAM enzyme